MFPEWDGLVGRRFGFAGGAAIHDQKCSQFNPSFRQLLHVGYKIAAKLGKRYLDMLEVCEQQISRNVTTNLLDRHLKPIFLGETGSEISS